MNRRQLFKGAVALVGASLAPTLAPCAWHPKGCVGNTCAGKPKVAPAMKVNAMTPEQCARIEALYGCWYTVGNIHDDYWVGYDQKLGSANSQPYRAWEERPSHMYAGRQVFYGKTWEEAIAYAEEYKKWLAFYDAEGSWMKRPSAKIYLYSAEREMPAGGYLGSRMEYYNYSVD